MTNTHHFFNALANKGKSLPGVYLLILKKFAEIPEENTDARLRIIRDISIDVVTMLADYDADFASYCHHENLTSHWRNLWCDAGYGLALYMKLPLLGFYEHPGLNHFELVCGIHFFHQSQVLRKKIQKASNRDFSASEEKSLQTAIYFGSIHAIQRYNEYIYADLQKAETQEAEKLYKKLIDNSKKSILTSGSYGYMIYAESLSNYCLWLIANSKIQKAEATYHAVLVSLEWAQKILPASKSSISNASLGRGLKLSNSLGLDSPEEAKRLFIKQYENARSQRGPDEDEGCEPSEDETNEPRSCVISC
ncbi:DUF5630 domain-containing protein [Legionella drozanskii]|uniref:Ankyrin repeat protein n=1 Tax=Legionella drozanskii LLAP-1 TaxID=1212489 RepID=A0A0W0SM33_9GAMM|nr:DUF5630 domain-containing protein [Legionella drozanskii]KTC84005.1 hypothetical protein Ldro_3125 [Legionella drozanskii LLAP-1]